MEVNTNKPLEEKNIIEKYTDSEGKYKVGSAMLELERRILGLEEAMQFFSEWYNKTQRSNLILPESQKIILPSGNTYDSTKSILD